MPDAKAAVWRTRDGGESWQDLRDGLPQQNAFFGVLRQAMATDRLEPAGVYFGTSSGTLFASADEGDSWTPHRGASADDLFGRDAGRRAMKRRCRVKRNRAAAQRHGAVRLPGVLVDLFPGAQRQVEVPAATVDEMIDALDARWPGMRDRLCNSTPALRRHINVFVDGERARLDTPLEPGADVFIMTAISGG